MLPPANPISHQSPFNSRRELSPEDLEMRKNLYGHSHSREKLHKYMEEKTRKQQFLSDRDEASKAPLSINNIDLKPLGNKTAALNN